MTESHFRVLAAGGDRQALVNLAHAFQAAGITFAAAAEPALLLQATAKFAPHAVLVFARPSMEDAMRIVAQLRGEPTWVDLPIVMVGNVSTITLAGVSEVVPALIDHQELAAKIIDRLQARYADSSPSADAGYAANANAATAARILLVDDDPALIKLFSIALSRSGFEVLTAADGEEGLASALKHRPDLVIADLNMPRLDGWGLLRTMRADHRVAEIPVMFLSCHDDYRENLKALSVGAQDYVAKGGKLESLFDRIRVLLAPRHNFLATFSKGKQVRGKIENLGVQWLLRRTVQEKASGRFTATDQFWSVVVDLAQGNLASVQASIGHQQLDGLDALCALVALRAGDLVFYPSRAVPGTTKIAGPSLVELFDQAATRNNQIEAEALDRLLVETRQLVVDEQLYRLYEQLGPPQSREIAALVYQGLTPREIMARSPRSPLEVENTLRDLYWRRVIKPLK